MPRQVARRAIAAAALFFCVAATPAHAPEFAALRTIAPGRWVLRSDEGGTRSLCLRDPAALLQLHHPGARCPRFVLEDGPRRLAVHYSCDGAGHGRTLVRVDTPRVLHLETVGVADGTPFDDSFTARHAGGC